MFRHQGKSRSLIQNLQIATVLSFVAGMVNVTGFLTIKQLTTNVTGHFALFVYDFYNLDFWKGSIYFIYILAFLAGSIFSGFVLEIFRQNKKLNVFVVPTFIEALILIGTAIWYDCGGNNFPNVVACLLLFAMGLQNSFVTKISGSVVRTTHLTGLFTDLGIDIAQCFFPEHDHHRKKLMDNIKLRIYIIFFFFSGGIMAAFLHTSMGLHLKTLIVAAAVLLLSLFFDDLRFRVLKSRRKRKNKTK
ncbi:MAG: DUF1275 domain-containing protein [Lewinellaceae bacterium]|nr:DUF1275 domain-containing protein [Lewinellaceae bacterium]